MHRTNSSNKLLRCIAALGLSGVLCNAEDFPAFAQQMGGLMSTVAGIGSPGSIGDGGAATLAQLRGPTAVAVDIAGNIYIADTDNQKVRKVNIDGVISTFAGTGIAGFSGDSGQATSAQLSGPTGIAVDTAGNLFIADFNNHRIRKVASNGVITTVSGNGTAGFSGDLGQATAAQLNGPTGIAVDSAGNLFIADFNNQRIRKVTTDGVINTFAGNGTPGSGGDGGPALTAQLFFPIGLAVDTAGNLFIADQGSNRIREVTLDGGINTVAGTGAAGFAGDGGPATSGQLNGPTGVALDAADNLLISDGGNNRIRKVTGGTITTVAGTGTAGFAGDVGPSTSAQINGSGGIAIDGSGNLYIADGGNNRIRKASGVGFNVFTFDPATISVTVSSTVEPAQQVTIPVGVTARFGATLRGTLTLSFSSHADNPAIDPMVQFVGSHNTAAAFTIPKGATQAVFEAPTANVFQTGTVAGTVTLTTRLVAAADGANVTPNPPLTFTTVNNKPPIIRSVSGPIGASFNITIVGFSTTRQLNQATFTFNGTNVVSSPIILDVSQKFTDWYQSSASAAFGSQFTLTVPFTTTGGALPLGSSVSVTLTNKLGPSATVTSQ